MKYKKRKTIRKIDKTEADILTGKQIIIDSKLGYKIVPETYEYISKKMTKATN